MGWRPPRCGSVQTRASMAKAAVLLSAVAMMVKDLGAPIHGNFYFRQAHVAANIEYFVRNGLSLVPTTYNLDVPYAIFDFPAISFSSPRSVGHSGVTRSSRLEPSTSRSSRSPSS